MIPPVVFVVEAKVNQALASFKAVNTQLTAMEAKAGKASAAMMRFNQVALIGTKVLKGLAAGFVIASAIGVKSIMDIEKSYAALGQAMANQGLATKQNLDAVSELVDGYESLGFGSEKAADAMKVLVTATGDLTKSEHLLSVAANLARAGQMSIEDAARSLVRAQAGNAKLFTQFGIVLDKNKPKAEAMAEAMAKLEQRLGGQAEAYAKTFAGQLAIMKEGLGDIFEAIGMKVLPVLNLFITKLNGAGKFIKDHSDLIVGLAIAIGVALVPAVINLTKSVILMSKAFLTSPLTWIAATLGLVAVGFVKAWNASETFRKVVIKVAQVVVNAFGYIVGAVGKVATGILKLVTGPMRSFLGAMSKIPGVGKWAGQALDFINSGIESIGGFFDDAANKIRDFSNGLSGLENKKIKIGIDLGMPNINDFFKGQNGSATGGATDQVNELSEALINAKQRAQDFFDKMVEGATKIHTKWQTLIGRDVNDSIRFGLLEPADQLVEKTGTLMKAYSDASSKFSSANAQLTSAQKAYENAVKGTDKALIASAEAALKKAEAVVEGVMGQIEGSLDDLQALQDEIVNAIVEAYKEIEKLQKERKKVLEDANKEEAKLTKDHLADLADLRKEYDLKVAQAQKDAAKRTAEIVKQSVDQLRGIYRSATQKSIGDIFASLTFEGRYLKGGTTDALINALGLQLSKANTLAEDAAQLSGLGFTQTFIEQVVAQGPDVGHQLAQTIINSTPESVKRLQEYWLALEKQSQHGVDNVAEKLNSGMTLATEELTASLAQVGKDLNDQLAVYATELTDATAKAVATYNERLKEIRDTTAATIADIDAQIAALNSRIASLRAAATQIATAQAPSTSAIIPFTPTEPIIENLPYKPEESFVPTPQEKAQVTPSTSKYVVKPGDTLSAIAKTAGTTLAQILKDNPKFTEVDKYKGGNMIWAGTTVNITANTNASSQSIANDVGWAVRTSSDVQYQSTVSPAKLRQLERYAE